MRGGEPPLILWKKLLPTAAVNHGVGGAWGRPPIPWALRKKKWRGGVTLIDWYLLEINILIFQMDQVCIKIVGLKMKKKFKTIFFASWKIPERTQWFPPWTKKFFTFYKGGGPPNVCFFCKKKCFLKKIEIYCIVHNYFTPSSKLKRPKPLAKTFWKIENFQAK